MSNQKTQTAPDLAARIAKKLLADYSIGFFSRFCDEPADFDAVEEEDLADDIREVINAKA